MRQQITLINYLSIPLCAALFAVATTAARAADWYQWGGPNRDFQVQASGLADKWPENGPPKVWSRPLAGGYSGVAVVGDTLYTMTREGEKDVVLALGTKDGKTKWKYKYDAPVGEPYNLEFGKGPHATPLVLDGRVYTIGFTTKMHCLDAATGKMIWSHDLIKDFGGKQQQFGYAASPLFYDGKILMLVGGDKHGVMAFDPKTGATAWAGPPLDISYASPKIINVDGQDQLIVMSSTEVMGLNPKNGEKLWANPCQNRYKNNATDPIWGSDNLLWVSTQLDGGTRALRLKQKDGKTTVEQAWFNDKVKVFHWNALRIGNHVYASIGGQTTRFAAIDMKDGEIEWREGGFHKALPIYADGKVIMVDEEGQLALAKVSPSEFKLLSKVQLTEKVSWTAPTLVDGVLYLRDQNQLMALNVKKSG